MFCAGFRFILPWRLHVNGSKKKEKKGKKTEPTKEKNRIIKHHKNIHKMNVRSKNSVCFNNGMSSEQEMKKKECTGKKKSQNEQQKNDGGL